MPIDIEENTWLADLVDDLLRDYDPAAALRRIPFELRATDPDGPGLEARARTLLVRSLRRKLLDLPAAQPEPSNPAPALPAAQQEDAFLGPVEDHVGLDLDIALVHGVPFDAERRRAELATLFAALTGGFDALRVVDPARPGGGDPASTSKAFVLAGAELKARGHPPGDPREGLPLRVGVLCIQRRHLARLAITYYGQGGLDRSTARKLLDQANGDAAMLIEVLASMAQAPGRFDARRRRICLAQVARMRFPRDLARKVRGAVRAPRSAVQLARAAPVRLRGFLLEQLLLSELIAGNSSPACAAVLQAFAHEAQIPPEQVEALQADATELYAGQKRWLEPSLESAADQWAPAGEEWEDFADHMMDRVATVVTENLEAIVTEIKETGELGQLLAKAAAGNALTAEERVKVKAQLIDLAKAVPALAIFAAPGGMVLLPLLAKLLPFNVLPSAWEQKKREKQEKGRS